MPYQRRKDGQVVKVDSEPIRRGDGNRLQSDTDLTDRIDGNRKGDSLFGPNVVKDRMGTEHLEAETTPISEKAGAKTRVISSPRDRAPSIAEDSDDAMGDPPVAWLVVVRGAGKGRVLTLGNGMNAIGRDPGSRVRIDFGDDAISSSNHAQIAYEPRRRKYLISHGDGTNLTYLDGEVVMGATELQAGAMVELGETTLRFQPFCSTEFDWKDVDD